ncbi:hypothetical protein HOY82DRAFT_604939 [Tuber indicum]|nr:hypothetical protein HOY82DRAFT_604939 [Tuber indicum]
MSSQTLSTFLELHCQADPTAPVKQKAIVVGSGAPDSNHKSYNFAKTDREQEQRMIDRIVRNRAAAQSSGERKQKEDRALEEFRGRTVECNRDMGFPLAGVEKTNSSLDQQLGEIKPTPKRY